MSRHERILAAFEGGHSLAADELARRLGVGRRTLANEVASLQAVLGSSASIVLVDGRYRLLAADPVRFRSLRAEISDTAPSFNDPEVRAGFIVAKLFRSLVPLRIDDLAAAMFVGRTTVVADLTRVRELVAEADLSIVGRPKVGLTLHGPELQQRLHVLRRHFHHAYPQAGADQRAIEEAVRAQVNAAGLDPTYVPELTRWALVAVDRVRTGDTLDGLPQQYAGLRTTHAQRFADELARRLVTATGIALPDDERTFLAMPVAGMRAPAEDSSIEVGAESDAAAIVRHVLTAVESEMGLDLDGGRFLGLFVRHVAYMLNRMRYGIWVDDAGVAGIDEEFPVAYRMATIAARVVGTHMGLTVDDAEVRFLATYFQLFLEARAPQPSGHLRVVIVTAQGRVSAELLQLQLAKLLPLSTRFEAVHSHRLTPQTLEGADLVVVTGDTPVQCTAPVLHVSRVLDRSALEVQVERAAPWLPLRHRSRHSASVLASSLDEAHFYALPRGTSYSDGVAAMTRSLEAQGLVNASFAALVRDREEHAVPLDPWVGFPHATVPDASAITLAVGVIPRDEHETGVRLIVLLGVPADTALSEDVLTAVYDEVLRLGARRDLLSRLCQVTSWQQFYYFMENNPLGER